LLAPTLPPLVSVFDLKIGHDPACTIDDDDIVMIFGPVEAGVIIYFLP
jgi:hypothetical protein